MMSQMFDDSQNNVTGAYHAVCVCVCVMHMYLQLKHCQHPLQWKLKASAR